MHLHRHPELVADALRACAAASVPLALVLETSAAIELMPDLQPRLIAGEIEVADVRRDVYLAYIRRVMDTAQSRLDQEHGATRTYDATTSGRRRKSPHRRGGNAAGATSTTD
jgi:hypothetical protein